MKCKLAEGVLAGKAVITTPDGASGYPPRLRREFCVYRDSAGPTGSAIAAIAAGHTPGRAAKLFEGEVGLRAAARTYRAALS